MTSFTREGCREVFSGYRGHTFGGTRRARDFGPATEDPQRSERPSNTCGIKNPFAMVLQEICLIRGKRSDVYRRIYLPLGQNLFV